MRGALRCGSWLGLLVILAAASPSALARVGAQDLEQAAAEVERARGAAGEAGAALAEARGEEQRLRASLEGLIGEVAAAQLRLGGAQHDARARARWLYMGAGTMAGTALPGAGEDAALRAVYAAAVGRADREVVNALAAAVADLERRREEVRREAAAAQRLAGRLSELEAAAGPVLAAAEAEFQRLRTEWEGQEAERLRRERVVAAAAATTTTTSSAATVTTTSTSTPVSTTTTLPGGEDGPFGPLVERWRPLVSRYFAPELVEEALAVIACESLGDPEIVNSSSGTAGLFQHHPLYWAERAAAAGFPGATPDDPEANTAAAAWLVEESVASGLTPWYFWACRP